MTGVGDRLWDGAEVFERRHEKSARVLLALQRTLEREHPLGGDEDEFLELAASLRHADADRFTQVWTDPSAYRWVRIAFHLLAATLRDTDPPAETHGPCEAYGQRSAPGALRRHLEHFKRFVLALDHLGGHERRLATPLQVDLPFALPGTPLCLDGAGSAELSGMSGLRLSACPTVAVEGARVRLQPEALHLPGLRIAETVLESGRAYQAEHQPLLEESMRLVARHLPDCFAQLREFVRVIALKPPRAGGFSNASVSELPGAFVVAVIESPHELADTLVHEFHHDRLFAIEEEGPFFESAEAGVRTEAFYSPWRPDLRPLQGILHAVYVHQPAWRFWRSVLASEPASARLVDYARDRLLRYALQISMGIDQLARHARFSGLGDPLFVALRRGADEILGEVESLIGDRDVAALACDERGALQPEGEDPRRTVRASLAQHARRFAPADQVVEVLGAAGLD